MRMHKQKHIKNDWSEMVSCSHCFAFDLFFVFLLWSIQTRWDNFYPSKTNVVALFECYCFSCLFHYISIDNEQSNVLPSTIPFSIAFLLTMSNLMLYLQHSYFASSERFVILLNFLVSQPYIVMIEHCPYGSTYYPKYANSKELQILPHWPILHCLEAKCGSSIIL